MRRIAFFVLGLACASFQSQAFAQGIKRSDLEKYPDIAYRLRAFELFAFLVADKQKEKGLQQSSEEYRRMDRAVTLISLELIEASVFSNRDKKLPNEKLERLSPAARAFYEYYYEALARNPVFRDPFIPLLSNKKAEFYSRYQNYHRLGFSDNERQAYEVAGSCLDQIMEIQSSTLYWKWIAVSLVTLSVAASTFVVYRRRRTKPTANPNKP